MREARVLKMESVIHEELCRLLPKTVKDPRVSNVTVTSVKLTARGRLATVHVAPLGGCVASGNEDLVNDEMRLCLDGLNSAAGHLKNQLRSRLNLKVLPNLRFKRDIGLENTMRVHELLQSLEI